MDKALKDQKRRATERANRASVDEARRDAEGVRARCRTLSGFVREAWRQIPELANVEYIHGWHIDLICAHLEAISSGRLLDLGYQNRLVINVVPGSMKSLLMVFWQAWEWAYYGPHISYITTSFRLENCKINTVRLRDLVDSEWYKELYGKDWKSGTKDKDGNEVVHKGVVLIQHGELHIRTSQGGSRRGIPFASLTGERADRLVIDDPHSTQGAESDAEREKAILNFRQRGIFSINDPKRSAIVVIMQRLHVGDLSGVIEELRLPFIRLVLPMRFESDRRCKTPIGHDPRKVEGELLFPQRMGLEYIDTLESGMTDFAVAGQHQQRPYLRGGSMFQRGWFTVVRAIPAGAVRVRGWDLAATKAKNKSATSGPAWTAGVRMSKAGAIFIVEHVQRQRTGPAEVKRAVKLTAQTDPMGTRTSIPQDPGQSSIAQRDSFAEDLVGFDVRFSPESGDKEDRAQPMAAQAEVGNFRILMTGDPARDAWIEPFLDEICTFPASRFKDQTDAASRAFAELLKMTKSNMQGDLGGPPSQVY